MAIPELAVDKEQTSINFPAERLHCSPKTYGGRSGIDMSHALFHLF